MAVTCITGLRLDLDSCTFSRGFIRRVGDDLLSR
jgi:hypothetical protein